MNRTTAAGFGCVLLVMVPAGAAMTGDVAQSQAISQRGPCWQLQPEASELVVHVPPAGLISGALHEHHFVPTEWSGDVCFDSRTPRIIDLELTVRAGSLEDRQPELSREDIQKVERQVRSADVLDASNYPDIRYVADRIDVTDAGADALTGTLQGHLSLHGQTHPLAVPIRAVWSETQLRVTGSVEFKQSDFGIEPYSRFLGTVRVADRISVEFAIDAVPCPPAEATPSGSCQERAR